jgi:metal-responsive CopG/Arc/MetJ family transcriptional regulator
VKTAISLNDDLFVRVERHAARLGISRSEFFARAAARWADELEGAELTDAIDAALIGAEDDGLDFVDAAARTLPHDA